MLGMRRVRIVVFAAAWGSSVLGQNIQLSGSCSKFTNPGQAFVLNGLGQRDSTSCDFVPANQTAGAGWGGACICGRATYELDS